MTDLKPTRGGARKGAGRPPKYLDLGKKIQVAYWLSPDVVAIIRQQPNQAEFIEEAVRRSIPLS